MRIRRFTALNQPRVTRVAPKTRPEQRTNDGRGVKDDTVDRVGLVQDVPLRQAQNQSHHRTVLARKDRRTAVALETLGNKRGRDDNPNIKQLLASKPKQKKKKKKKKKKKTGRKPEATNVAESLVPGTARAN